MEQVTANGAELNEQELRQATAMLEQDQILHLRNNEESLNEFLGNLNFLKSEGGNYLKPAVVQTAFFLAAGGRE